tara:strand:- start:3482 stop:4792 length:1311 start_codon:yes stop_codon:yes gene_type:complete
MSADAVSSIKTLIKLPKIEALIAGLQKQQEFKYDDLSAEFKGKISQDEYGVLLYNLIQMLLTNKNVLNHLIKDGVIRLKKHLVHDVRNPLSLPRTVQIYTDKHENYNAILETKSKLSGGKQDPFKNKKIKKGAYKTCKTSYLLNPKEGNVGDKQNIKVSLVIKCNPAIKGQGQDDLFKEATISLMTDAGLDSYAIMHKCYKKITFYCQKGESLDNFLRNKDLYDTLSLDDKQDIFKCLLIEISVLHKIQVIHQDIKPENIIIFYDDVNHKYYAKLNDFGLCNKVQNGAMATLGYESPEMVESNFIKESYGAICCSSTLAKFSASNDRNKNHKEPDIKNDIWALGIVYLELFYNHLLFKQEKSQSSSWFCSSTEVKYIRYDMHAISESFFQNVLMHLAVSDSFLSGLLEYNRDKRVSAEQALELMEKCFSKKTKLSC